ncbi:YmfQ family protein [Castellaniella caeni]|uniref:YmfQ family protein n=1 Tax=Castellaniella caeni TaxID=266123 RepID=UPI000C9FD205|nr:putative phage tail protein [Castellaniella caeni]
MKGAQLLASLLPPVSYAPNAPQIATTLRAEGAQLDAAQQSAGRALAAVTPFGAGELLVDWERLLGLSGTGGYQQRLDAVLAKLAEVGGLSIPYFISLAKRLGYAIQIIEPQPFRADASRAGDAVYVDEVIWCFQVVVEGATTWRVYPFRAGSSVAGDRVLTFGDPVIEEVLNDLKPGHTFVYFAYQ